MQAQIPVTHTGSDFLSENELDHCMELGHEASKEGDLNESLAWFMKGLESARKLQNKQKISEFSALIYCLL